MKLKISHTTRYQFLEAAHYGLQQLRLTPKSRPGQKVLEWEMEIGGGKLETSFLDQNANQVSLVSFDRGAHEVSIACTGIIETEDLAGITGKHAGFVPIWLFQRSTPLTRAGNNVRSLTKGLREEESEDLPRLHKLSDRIRAAVPYTIGVTDAQTTAEAAIEIGGGVCQDHAHIFIAAARSMGYAARYISGYLSMDDRIHQEASHGWAEAHVPSLGWVGFDISNGYSPDARYVRVATGLDYSECAPIAGIHYGAVGEEMTVDIQVQQQ